MFLILVLRWHQIWLLQAALLHWLWLAFLWISPPKIQLSYSFQLSMAFVFAIQTSTLMCNTSSSALGLQTSYWLWDVLATSFSGECPACCLYPINFLTPFLSLYCLLRDPNLLSALLPTLTAAPVITQLPHTLWKTKANLFGHITRLDSGLHEWFYNPMPWVWCHLCFPFLFVPPSRGTFEWMDDHFHGFGSYVSTYSIGSK